MFCQEHFYVSNYYLHAIYTLGASIHSSPETLTVQFFQKNIYVNNDRRTRRPALAAGNDYVLHAGRVYPHSTCHCCHCSDYSHHPGAESGLML